MKKEKKFEVTYDFSEMWFVAIFSILTLLQLFFILIPILLAFQERNVLIVAIFVALFILIISAENYLGYFRDYANAFPIKIKRKVD